MEIRFYSPSEQVDPAVDLGILPAPLPQIEFLREFVGKLVQPPPEIVDGWFDAPRSKVFERRLKAGLEAFGCDPKVFTYSQPVRVPGAWREGKLQRLVWLRQ